jgi:hypothetical protein
MWCRNSLRNAPLMTITSNEVVVVLYARGRISRSLPSMRWLVVSRTLPSHVHGTVRGFDATLIGLKPTGLCGLGSSSVFFFFGFLEGFIFPRNGSVRPVFLLYRRCWLGRFLLLFLLFTIFNLLVLPVVLSRNAHKTDASKAPAGISAQRGLQFRSSEVWRHGFQLRRVQHNS